jgi:hypothetical protein
VPFQTEIRIDSSGSYYEVSSTPSVQDATTPKPSERKLQQAQISLNDCLACRHVIRIPSIPYPTLHVPKWMHHVGRIGLDHSTVTHGGAQLPRGKPTREFTGAQGSSAVDRTPMSGIALGDIVVKLSWTSRTEAGHAASGSVLHAGVGL